MKVRRLLVTLVLVTIFAMGTMAAVNADEENAGGHRPSEEIDINFY